MRTYTPSQRRACKCSGKRTGHEIGHYKAPLFELYPYAMETCNKCGRWHKRMA